MPKILLCGNDKELIDSLFSLEKSSIMFMTTTDNPEDIRRHLKMFVPKAFVFCLNNQSDESLEKVGSVLEYIKAANAAFVLVGNDAEIDVAYTKFGGDKIYDTFAKELGLKTILDKIEELDGSLSSSSLENFASPPDIPSSGIESLESLDSLDEIQNTIVPDQEPKPHEKKKILVVDDDANMLRTLKLYLQDEYTVAVANSGQVALKFLEEKTVDLILLDYMMPTMDGPMTLSYIRKSVMTHKIPVIFLTGVSDRDKIRQILGMKVQGYLLKPVDSKKLHEIINRTLTGGTSVKTVLT